uniref:Putative serine carboxypeptidase cpvl n=1 Tax=Amblyomma cajennense TaxID=34607 RepID=A0A023FUS3_AMBCJ
MELSKCFRLLLLLAFGLPHMQCTQMLNTAGRKDCQYINESGPSEDLTFLVSDFLSEETLKRKRYESGVCLPEPCSDLQAYSGFISVEPKNSTEDNSFLFFLYIRSKVHSPRKPLLLWLQGGPGKSSLFGEFLENGPLGIDAFGKLYYRNHTLLKYADIVYLDQPVGSGYSFNRKGKYNGTLQEASTHISRFLYRFATIFPRNKGKDLFIAGESYGARSAIGAASKILKKKPESVLFHLKGVMLGVGFLFPLLNIIDSTDYLYYTGLLDEEGKTEFEKQFKTIRYLVEREKNYTAAGYLLSKTVLNLRSPGSQSLFEMLTGFKHHGSIIMPQRNRETFAYYAYANSTEFKKRIHVSASRTLDGTRPQIAFALAAKDFFVDHKHELLHVLNNRHVLLYTAQLDDVFPAINIMREFRNLEWRGAEHFKNASRTMWHLEGNTSLELLGYEKRAVTLMYASVLFGGHYVSLDRSYAVSDLYGRFFEFQGMPPPNSPDTPSC